MTDPVLTRAEEARDLCKRGCGIVHSLPCEAPGRLYGQQPVRCQRAFCHSGDHEWRFGPEDARVWVWENIDD